MPIVSERLTTRCRPLVPHWHLHRPVANASLCFRKEFVSAVFGKKVGAAQIFKHAAQLSQPRSDRPPPSAYPRDGPIRATPAADAEDVEALYDCRLTSRPHRIGRNGASGHRLVCLLTRRVCLSVAATALLRRRTEGTSYKPMHRPCCLLIPTGKAQAHPGAKVASHTTPTVEVTTQCPIAAWITAIRGTWHPTAPGGIPSRVGYSVTKGSAMTQAAPSGSSDTCKTR
jgi:hypothetical protein